MAVNIMESFGRVSARTLSCFSGKSARQLSSSTMWTVCICLVFLSTDVLVPGVVGELSCTSVKGIFDSRGMQSSDLLNEPFTGSSAGYCSSVSSGSCCGTGTQSRLMAQSRAQLDALVRDQLARVSMQLAARANKFDSFFRELLTQSKREFHEMFTRTYGMIYERHSYVFTDLFAELERYYTRGDVNLAHSMDTFFAVLYQKMFTVLNSQYHFDDKYLHCVNEHMKELQPFGDVPHKLSVQLRRAFVATRTFQRALQSGADVVKNMIGIRASVECATAMASMRWCGACAGLEEPRACPRFCLNTIRGCLPYHADLAADWDTYVDALDKVADRLLGPFNIAMVVEPIDIKISEAIMNFQEHAQELSQRVFTGCGKPILGQRPTDTGTYFAPPQRRDRRSILRYNSAYKVDGLEDLSPKDTDDFEIETSYDSLIDKNPFLLLNKNYQDDRLFTVSGLEKDHLRRDNILKLLKKPNVEDRTKRDANPEPARNSKEIDFEPYDFNSSNQEGKRKGNRRPSSGGKKSELEESPVVPDDEKGSGDGGVSTGGTTLEKLVSDARNRVKNTKKFWSLLPHSLCNDEVIAVPTTLDQKCFNATAVGSYSHPLAGEGSTAMATNPEAKGSGFSSSPVLMAQQFTLRNVAAKLKNAYNGQDVEWKDYEDTASVVYGSGSGSGDDIDDTEDSEPPPDMEDDLEGSGQTSVETEDETETDYDTEAPEAPRSGLDEVFRPSVVINKVNTHNVEISGPRQDTAAGAEDGDSESESDSEEANTHDERPRADVANVGSGSSDGSGSASAAPKQMSLQRALLAYLFPIVCVWLGGIVSDIL